jgi:hypothetical protein
MGVRVSRAQVRQAAGREGHRLRALEETARTEREHTEREHTEREHTNGGSHRGHSHQQRECMRTLASYIYRSRTPPAEDTPPQRTGSGWSEGEDRRSRARRREQARGEGEGAGAASAAEEGRGHAREVRVKVRVKLPSWTAGRAPAAEDGREHAREGTRRLDEAEVTRALLLIGRVARDQRDRRRVGDGGACHHIREVEQRAASQTAVRPTALATVGNGWRSCCAWFEGWSWLCG